MKLYFLTNYETAQDMIFSNRENAEQYAKEHKFCRYFEFESNVSDLMGQHWVIEDYKPSDYPTHERINFPVSILC